MIRLILVLCLPIALFAEPVIAYRGQKLSSIEEKGFVRLIECQVTGRVKVEGTLEAEDCNLQTMVVKGTTVLKGCEIGGRCEFSGKFMARTSNFIAPITIDGQLANFGSCKTHDINVRIDNNQVAYVHLVNTLVLGNIEFIRGSGHVLLDRGSSIKGVVKGGKAIKHGSSQLN